MEEMSAVSCQGAPCCRRHWACRFFHWLAPGRTGESGGSQLSTLWSHIAQECGRAWLHSAAPP